MALAPRAALLAIPFIANTRLGWVFRAIHPLFRLAITLESSASLASSNIFGLLRGGSATIPCHLCGQCTAKLELHPLPSTLIFWWPGLVLTFAPLPLSPAFGNTTKPNSPTLITQSSVPANSLSIGLKRSQMSTSIYPNHCPNRRPDNLCSLNRTGLGGVMRFVWKTPARDATSDLSSPPRFSRLPIPL